MKAVCEQKTLQDALNVVGKIVGGRSTLPVLDNVLIKAEKDSITFVTTNLEIAIEKTVKADIQKEGVITVPVKLFVSYVSLLPSGNVELEVDENLTLHVKGEGSTTELKGIASDEFPLIPKIKPDSTIKIASAVLKDAFEKTVFATAFDQIRPVLTGVYLCVNKKDAVIVGTDSFRLAEKKIKLLEDGGEVKSIIPNRTVAELVRILGVSDEPVEVKLSKNQALFEIEGTRVTTRLIEGTYPPYEQIIPKKSETISTLKKDDFSKVVRRVSLFAREKANNIKLETKKDAVVVSATSSQVGGEEAEVGASSKGDSKKIAFNAMYLLDVLGRIDGDELELGISSETKPGLIKSKESSDYQYVVMPLNLG